jgi:hypothetical protein
MIKNNVILQSSIHVKRELTNMLWRMHNIVYYADAFIRLDVSVNKLLPLIRILPKYISAIATDNLYLF